MTTILFSYILIGCICTLISIRAGLFPHKKVGIIGYIMLVYVFIFLWPLLVGMYVIAFLKALIKELQNRGYL